MNSAALLQFVNAKGVGIAAIRRLANFVMHEGVQPDDVVKMQAEDIAAILKTTVIVAANVLGVRDRSMQQAEEMDAEGIEVVWIADPQYPDRLKAILGNDAPPMLCVRGNTRLFDQPAVGFCGSRKASEKGLEVTESTAQLLAKDQICVVSGYAHGVDMTAHRAALEAGGTTIMVLVDGILRFKVKKGIEDVLTLDNHLIVSQFPPNLVWIGRNAMKRNGTIIGLSDAMVLVESGNTGGTFAAGTETLKRQHPLFVIDFAAPGPSAEANPAFIERGGIPIRGNRDGVPNIDRLLETIRQPTRDQNVTKKSLFEEEGT